MMRSLVAVGVDGAGVLIAHDGEPGAWEARAEAAGGYASVMAETQRRVGR
jgi:hypothetical protein